jgi:hypothetical protein
MTAHRDAAGCTGHSRGPLITSKYFKIVIGWETGSELISTVAGVQLLEQSLAEQDDGATWTLFLAGSAVARHPAREQSRGDLFRRRRLRLLCERLAAAAVEDGCAIHAYELMTNHVHLLVTPGGPRACRAPCSRLAAAPSAPFSPDRSERRS